MKHFILSFLLHFMCNIMRSILSSFSTKLYSSFMLTVQWYLLPSKNTTYNIYNYLKHNSWLLVFLNSY